MKAQAFVHIFLQFASWKRRRNERKNLFLCLRRRSFAKRYFFTGYATHFSEFQFAPLKPSLSSAYFKEKPVFCLRFYTLKTHHNFISICSLKAFTHVAFIMSSALKLGKSHSIINHNNLHVLAS